MPMLEIFFPSGGGAELTKALGKLRNFCRRQGASRALSRRCALGRFACSGGCSGVADGSTASGARAPDFAVDLLNGSTFRLSDHIGKHVVVIDFWTTFCQPCLPAMLHLEEIYKKYGKQGLVVLGVSMDPRHCGNVPLFVRSRGLTFPVAHDAQSRVTDLYNKKSSAPFQVLISKQGVIVKQREAYQPGDEVGMEEDIKAALAQELFGLARDGRTWATCRARCHAFVDFVFFAPQSPHSRPLRQRSCFTRRSRNLRPLLPVLRVMVQRPLRRRPQRHLQALRHPLRRVRKRRLRLRPRQHRAESKRVQQHLLLARLTKRKRRLHHEGDSTT